MSLSPEDQLTSWLRRRVASRGADLLGDDAAFLPGTRSAVTVDQHLEGVHFPAGLSPAVIGRRLVAVNLSDVAAIGGRPTYAFLTAAVPSGFPTKAFLSAVERELWRHGALLAGGDLARSEILSTSLTLMAERRPQSRWVRRDSGRAGDRVWIGGSVGESALGQQLLAAGARFEGGRPRLPSHLVMDSKTSARARRAIRRHLRPVPQLELGAWLARRRRAAAIDISDGLLLDLGRLCRTSGVSAVIDIARLELDSVFRRCAQVAALDPVELALSGGEDYVLLFALPPGIRPPAALGATSIGTLTSGRGVKVTGSSTRKSAGWDHFST